MPWHSNDNPMFRSKFSEDIFKQKYAHEGCETWSKLAFTLAHDVVPIPEIADEIGERIADLKFIPGGRYLYYAGRPNKFFNNCYILISQEDTREDWADLSYKAQACLMTGGGIGNDYSVYRPKGSPIRKTGGVASGPISAMEMINEIGRHVMQGGSRRSAIYASLRWDHADAQEFLGVKDWDNEFVAPRITHGDLKRQNFNHRAPLDMTNISLNYDTEWLLRQWDHDKFLRVEDTFLKNTRMALKNGEPGFSFNFFDKENETGRNACTEVTSADDCDVCNLGSINMARIETIEEFAQVVELGTTFLLYGTLKAQLPLTKIERVREKNRRLGLGLMGVHEWLLKRGYRYEMVEELHRWLAVYRGISDRVARDLARALSISVPVAVRAVAPTGTIGILAGTTTGIEPIFATAFKRTYVKNGDEHHYQFVIDSAAQNLIEQGIEPDSIESALDLAKDPERRIKFQAGVQEYVDQGISSTINLPAWGSEHNNPDTVLPFAKMLARHAHRLRGFTCYPDGARGGQPLEAVSYHEIKDQVGREFKVETVDVCDISGKGGTCGV
jgi:ribonucleoside-diphosphate reductase alpha chain